MKLAANRDCLFTPDQVMRSDKGELIVADKAEG